MKTTLTSAAAGIELQAVNGQLVMIVTRIIKGDGQRADCLCVITQEMTTEEAGAFADAVTGMACIAEEQAYQQDIDHVFGLMGLPIPDRDHAEQVRP